MGFPLIDLRRMNLFGRRNLINGLVFFENFENRIGFEIG